MLLWRRRLSLPAALRHASSRPHKKLPPDALGRDEIAAADREPEGAAAAFGAHRPDRFPSEYAFLTAPVAQVPEFIAGRASDEMSVDAIAATTGMGAAGLRRWRSAVAAHNAAGKHLVSPACSSLSHVRTLIRHSVGLESDLRALVSPLLQFAEGSDGANGGIGGPTLVARRDIPRGQFLISIPLDSCLVANPPALRDAQVVGDGSSPVVVSEVDERHFDFAAPIEDLSAQLLMALVDATNPHHAYATYLRARPTPNNAPFMRRGDIPADKPEALAYHDAINRILASPMCGSLADIDRGNLQWAVSHVLSRQIGGAMMCPVVDLLNHDDPPNAHYTVAESELNGSGSADAGGMAALSHITVADVLDNVMAGVAEEDLGLPHLHVQAIAPVTKGEPVVLNYAGLRVTPDAFQLQWGFRPPRPDKGEPMQPLNGPNTLDRVTSLLAWDRLCHRAKHFGLAS